ncbi:RluA family pseudouridine synthase [Nitrosomonas sp.]|uniref:RluA family pseudouridine synthase n=1 Tax=Nitrosomonas sp. TaxID=42353 RepID=UPI0025EB0BC4|nr:RluA family pseudouridine synthase [Nitrosomonas sp.]MCC6916732.1 RluA family pseudouridine synthase [Nitrosomonas sp.]
MKSIGKSEVPGKEKIMRGIISEHAAVKQIDEGSEGQRIDNFLIKLLKGIPRRHIYQLLRSGQVRVNSKRIDASYRLQLDDKVRIPPVIRPASPISMQKTYRADHFDVLYQDDQLLVINKPAGTAVHGGSGISHGVIEQLRRQHPDWKFLELVHRLDRETSGILLLARKRQSLLDLHRQIREGTVEKYYLALVRGRWKNPVQHVRLPLNKYLTAEGERRVAVASDKNNRDKAQQAHTLFTLQQAWEDFSLLRAELKTGRTHQIRVHLAHLGFPIAGDDKYGDFGLNKQLQKDAGDGLVLRRMFLHATVLVCTHPVTGNVLRLEAPLPDELRVFLRNLDLNASQP